MNDDTFVPRRANPPGAAVIGVVVPVPEPWAQLLVDWRSKVGDPQAALVPPHVTLLPPTEVPAIRSKRRPSGSPTRASSSASTTAAYSPRYPPPLSARMRNSDEEPLVAM